MTEGWGTPPEANATIGHNNPPETTGWGTASEAAVQLPKFEVKYKAQPETEEPEAFRLRRNAEIEAWQASKPTLEQAKQNEADLRARVTATLFPTPTKGTQRYELGNGYKVKLVFGLTYTIGNKDATTEDGEKITIETQVRDLEDAIISEFGQVGEALIKRLIKWKPELSGSEYEKLDANDPVELAIRDKIAELTTIKPASPQLTFEEPKGK